MVRYMVELWFEPNFMNLMQFEGNLWLIICNFFLFFDHFSTLNPFLGGLQTYFLLKIVFLFCWVGHKDSKDGFKILFNLNTGRAITIFV